MNLFHRLTFVLWIGACGCNRAQPPAAPPPDPEAKPAEAPAQQAPAPQQPEPQEEEQAPEALDTEAPEVDPASTTVKLRIEVAPRSAKPTIWWGKKKLGESPLVLERPRRSGPMDIVIKADGFLEHHTRLFTDRNDRLSFALIRPGDAVGMLGYKRKPGDIPPGSVDETLPPTPAPETLTPSQGASGAEAAGTSGTFVVPSGVSF